MSSEKMQNSENNLSLELAHPSEQNNSILLARTLCPWANHVNDETMIILVAYVASAGNTEATADITGFSPDRISRAYRSPIGQRIIGNLASADLVGTGALIAINTLKQVATAESASPAARVSAAKTLLELSKHQEAKSQTQKGQAGHKDLNQMTIAELEKLINETRQVVGNKHITIEHE